MKLFDFLQDLHLKSEKIKFVPVEEPKEVIGKTTDIKEYKRQYYLQNLETYRKRNEEYRERKRKEKEKINKDVIEYNKEVKDYNKNLI